MSPNTNPQLEDLDPRIYGRWMLAFWVSSAIAIPGLVSTWSQPDSHPVLFPVSVCWVIVVVVAGVTRERLLRADPLRFRFARWEREGQFYDWVGVTAFGWLLLQTPLGWLNPWLALTSRRAGLERLLREINFAEGAHRIGGVITLGFAVGYGVAGHLAVGLSFALLTVLVHAYPVMLQRRNRGRVLRLIRRGEAGQKLRTKS